MKDVVSENPHFDIDTFIGLLRDRIYSKDGFARQFLVSWVCVGWLQVGSTLNIPPLRVHELILPQEENISALCAVDESTLVCKY